MEMSRKIYLLRTENNLTQSEFAKIAGATDKAVSSWENGTRSPKLKYTKPICEHFGIDLNTFVDEGNDVYKAGLPSNATPLDIPSMHRIPILGRIAAGLPLYADQHIEGYTMTDLNGGAEYFALRVSGDSMNAARIEDGDVIIVRRQDEVENGELAVVMVGDEDATVKRFYSTGSTVTLMPQSTNPSHQPQIYDLKKTKVRVLGKVIEIKIMAK